MKTTKTTWQKIWARRVELTLGAAIVTMFFNVGVWLWNPNSFRLGLFDPFATPRILLCDVFILLAIVFFFTRKEIPQIKWQLRPHWLITAILGAIALVLASAALGLDPWRSAFFIGRILELALFVFVLKQSELSWSNGLQILGVMGALEAILALGQFIWQRSVGVGFLGESPLGSDIGGVAKFDFLGVKIIRAYGTFPHANLLGGALGAAFVLMLSKDKKDAWDKVILTLLGVGLILSLSRAAILGAVLGSLFLLLTRKDKIVKKLALGAVIVVVILGAVLAVRGTINDSATAERMTGWKVAGEIIWENPLLGTGAGNYTLALDNKPNLAVWEKQPVHDVPLLWVAELGLPAAILLLTLLGVFVARRIKWAQTRTIAIWAMLLPPLLLDHYFWDVPQGAVLAAILLWLMLEMPRERTTAVIALNWRKRKKLPVRKYSRRRPK